MGFFDSESSSTTNITDSRKAVTGGSSLQEGQSINNTTILTDGGAFQAVKDVAGFALQKNADVSGFALQKNADVSGFALLTNENVVDSSLISVDNTVSKALQTITAQQEKNTEALNSSNTTLKGIALESIGAVKDSVRSDAVETLNSLVYVLGFVGVAFAWFLGRK